MTHPGGRPAKVSWEDRCYAVYLRFLGIPYDVIAALLGCNQGTLRWAVSARRPPRVESAPPAKDDWMRRV